MRGADNQVDVGDQTVGIGGVVVDERAARRFGDAYASRCPRRNLHPCFGAGDLGIVQQADGVFGVVEQLDQPRPVIEQRELCGPAELRAELLQFGLRQWRVDVVADVNPRQSVGAIYALRIFDIHGETFAPLFGVGELQVAPRLNVLGRCNPCSDRTGSPGYDPFGVIRRSLPS